MYYHPLVLPKVSTEQSLRACRALSDAWLSSIERHHAAQAAAAKNFRSAQLENARALWEAEDSEQFATRLLAYVAVEPFRLAVLVAEFGEIAVDAHRRMLTLLSTNAQDVQGGEHEAPARANNRSMSSRKLQMMA
jgi:hypothetical protein